MTFSLKAWRSVTFYSIIMTTTYVYVCEHTYIMSWPENQGILFFYISQTLQMNQISFMAFLLNAVL